MFREESIGEGGHIRHQGKRSTERFSGDGRLPRRLRDYERGLRDQYLTRSVATMRRILFIIHGRGSSCLFARAPSRRPPRISERVRLLRSPKFVQQPSFPPTFRSVRAPPGRERRKLFPDCLTFRVDRFISPFESTFNSISRESQQRI